MQIKRILFKKLHSFIYSNIQILIDLIFHTSIPFETSIGTAAMKIKLKIIWANVVD